MKIHFIRHATFVLTYNGKRIIVDPMLSKAGKMPAVPDVVNTSPNPLVELPAGTLSLTNIDGILLTHKHRDHFDEAAMHLLSHKLPLFCQEADEQELLRAGFTRVKSIRESFEWDGISLTRIGGCHGTGKIGEKMGPVSGFILSAVDEPTLYIVGDSIWCWEVEQAIDNNYPQVIVCYAGAAMFNKGGAITMTKEDIYEVCQKAPGAQVVVLHMEAWNHCTLTRKELRQYIQEKSQSQNVLIPDDGESLNF